MAGIAKKFAIGLVILLLAGAGAASLITENLFFSGTATYNLVKDVSVEASATFDGEIISEYSYDGQSTAADWQVPDIELSRTARTVIYRFSFVNNGNFDVVIDVVPSDLSGTNYAISGGAKVATEQGTVFMNDPQFVAPKEIIEFEFVLTLERTSSSVDKNISFSITADYIN